MICGALHSSYWQVFSLTLWGGGQSKRCFLDSKVLLKGFHWEFPYSMYIGCSENFYLTYTCPTFNTFRERGHALVL